MSSPHEREVIVVANPVSTNADIIEARVIDPLIADNAIRRGDILWTPDASYHGMVNAIGSRISPGAIVVAAGGDGLAHYTGNAIRAAAMCDVELLVAPCGNACDISRSYNRGDLFDEPNGLLSAIRHGDSQPVAAIETTIGDCSRIALGYLGVGMTAKISELLTDPEHRAGRPSSKLLADARDLLAMGKVFMTGQPFRYQEAGRENESYEILISAIGRLAKIMRFDVPPKSVISTEFSGRHFLKNLIKRTITEALRQGLRGQPFDRRTIQIVNPEGTQIQWDGETEKLPAGSQLDIVHVPDALNIRIPTKRFA